MKSAPGRNLILYKYYPPERKNFLKEQILCFSHPNRFNDPFELEPYFEAVTIGPRMAQIFAERFTKDDGSRYTPEELLSQFETDQARREAIDELKQNLLILSMSEECDSLLMWAYYAKAHTGFAVGFDMSKDSIALRADGRSRQLSKVRYSTHRPTFETKFHAATQEKEIRLTKSVEWMHEKEWRMFESPFNADGDCLDGDEMCWPFRFEPEVVERVILGARINADVETSLRDALSMPEYAHTKLLRCEVHQQQFRLNIRLEDIHN